MTTNSLVARAKKLSVPAGILATVLFAAAFVFDYGRAHAAAAAARATAAPTAAADLVNFTAKSPFPASLSRSPVHRADGSGPAPPADDPAPLGWYRPNSARSRPGYDLGRN